MAWDTCDGHDLYAVREKTAQYLALARDEFKPSVLEIDTYRYRGHSVADPDKTYRKKAEIEEYQKTRDPIQLFQNLLRGTGVLDDALIAKIDAEART